MLKYTLFLFLCLLVVVVCNNNLKGYLETSSNNNLKGYLETSSNNNLKGYLETSSNNNLKGYLETSSNNNKIGKLNAPVKAVYIDYVDINWMDGSTTIQQVIDAGFNMIILCFWTYDRTVDMTEVWTQLSESKQQDTMDYVHQNNAVVLVAAGGQTEIPYFNVDSTLYGESLAYFANQNYLDGIVFDLENFNRGMTDFRIGNSTLPWIIDATIAARRILGPDKIISHAPQAPYFGPITNNSGYWSGSLGGYSLVEKSTSEVDYYLIQFYNQGLTCYTTFQGLFTQSSFDCPMFPGTSINEIASYGIPLYKIINGKYTTIYDGANGWIDPNQLGSMNNQAYQEIGWQSGISTWLWRNNIKDWLSLSWPFSFNQTVNFVNITSSSNISSQTIGLCSVNVPCIDNKCCSRYGYCGSTSDYCGRTCVNNCSPGTPKATPSIMPTTLPPDTIFIELNTTLSIPPTTLPADTTLLPTTDALDFYTISSSSTVYVEKYMYIIILISLLINV
jgi:hypothetical protein